MRDGPLGLLMLDTTFERFPGDIGHPATWPGPVLSERIEGATAARVTTLADESLLAPFLAGARRLEARGASIITTSCGFLVLYQSALADAVSVPVATSALVQVPWLARLLRRPVGVLTFDPTTLGPAHLAAAGADAATPVGGLSPDSLMRRDILGGAPANFATREAEVVAAARALAAAHPSLGALVLECTNFPPHAAAIATATGLPVYDVVTLVRWMQAGHAPSA
jgi:hypothetical protein